MAQAASYPRVSYPDPCAFCLGGTAEGRALAQTDLPLVYSAATEYGEQVISPRPNLVVRSGALVRDLLVQEFSRPEVRCVIDATHPYAASISASARACALAAGKPLCRLARDASADDVLKGVSTLIRVADEQAAARILHERFAGQTFFLSTGANRIQVYSDYGLTNFAWARILPFGPSHQKALDAGILQDRLIEAQGPFGVADNIAHFRASGARVLVTKDGGATGGFPEKIEAARALGMAVIVLERPREEHEGVAVFSRVEEVYEWAKRILTME